MTRISSFPAYVLPAPGFNLWYRLLSLLQSVTVPLYFFAFLNFDLDIDGVFCRMFFRLCLSDVSLKIRLRLWIWEKDTHKWCAISSHPISGYIVSTWLILGNANLEHLGKVVSGRFLYWKLLFFYPNTLVTRNEFVTKSNLHSRVSRELRFTSGKRSIKEFRTYVKTTTAISP